jgi:membrane protein involved in colicin uptake
MNKITGMDKMDKTARTMSRTTQQSAHTAMDYALKAQEMNTRLLQRTSQAWIEGFRYQAKLSQGMAQVFFGQRGNAFASTARVELPVQEQSKSKVTEPATDGAQKVTEAAAKDARKNTEIAAKDTQKAEAQKAEKVAKEAEKAAKDAKAEKAEKVAKDTRKAEKAAEETQKATETAAKSAQNSTELAAEKTQKSTGAATFPIEGYDEMNVGEVSQRLDGLSADELKRVGKYEKDNKDRGSLRKEMKQKIKTTS